MYRFKRADNERAQHFFETAARLDPTFSRAYAGLSFTHFQNAFQGWGKRAPEIERAYQTAESALTAAARPNAHVHILAIAAYCLALAARSDEAREHLAAIRRRLPGYRVDDFLAAMQFDAAGAALFKQAARRIG